MYGWSATSWYRKQNPRVDWVRRKRRSCSRQVMLTNNNEYKARCKNSGSFLQSPFSFGLTLPQCVQHDWSMAGLLLQLAIFISAERRHAALGVDGRLQRKSSWAPGHRWRYCHSWTPIQTTSTTRWSYQDLCENMPQCGVSWETRPSVFFLEITVYVSFNPYISF